MNKIYFLITCFLLAVLHSCDQSDETKAEWIQHPSSNAEGYGVYLFKTRISLEKVPDKLIVNVSADNRYKLYVNGNWVGLGPARGDLKHWFFESYDLQPYLKNGLNIITAEVWNFGEHKPLAQISSETGFYFKAENKKFSGLNSGSGKWKTQQVEAYEPIAFGSFIDKWYYVCGPGDSVNYFDYPFNWMKDKGKSGTWLEADVVKNSYSKWNLIPREIPHLTRDIEKITALDRVEGDGLNISPSREPFKNPIIIPSNKSITLLFDQEYLTVGYPVLKFSKGHGSHVKITYAESLYHSNRDKGNRDEIENKKIIGYHDHFLADGRDKAEFIPLWWRTFRYIQLDIATGKEELILEDFFNYYVAYPYKQNAVFKTDKPVIDEIMETGARTLKLCSGETFYDCPYYEQLQYIGDTRVEALISMYMTGDDRLVRNAITQFSNTFIEEGLTLSRHPANYPQIIPGFSMYWISMLYDYLMIRDDPGFVQQYLPGINSIIGYFEDYVNEKDMLGNLDWGKTEGGGLPEFWYFTDWSRGYKRGIPQGVYDNNSSVISLHLANTLIQAAKIEEYFGNRDKASEYLAFSKRLKEGTIKHCFDEEKGLIAQTPDKRQFSQHANILGILSDAIPSEIQKQVMEKILEDEHLIQVSMYFSFYLFEALKKIGRADEYLDRIDFWYQSLERGLTTFPEKERTPRSDCHAWNSSPMYHFLSLVAGIEPAEPGFKTVSIQPAFGELSKIEAVLPHPKGFIEMILGKTPDGRIKGKIMLPEGVEGVFKIYGKRILLEDKTSVIDIDHSE